MKTSEAFWMFLPKGLEELFDLVKIEMSDKSYDLWLDEKKERSDEDRKNRNIVAKGYTEYTTLQDFPMRGRPMYLHMRKCRWLDKDTNTTFSYTLELPGAEETRLTKEFVAFLKYEGGDDGPGD